jgi:hypothetical protein
MWMTSKAEISDRLPFLRGRISCREGVDMLLLGKALL